MGKILLTLLLLGTYLFGSEGAVEGSTDILQRTVNFLIFAGILVYVLAEPLKNYFSGRSEKIASELEKVQERLRESKHAKELAEQKIEEAHRNAIHLQEGAKKEAKVLSDRILAQCESDMEIMHKQNMTRMEFEKRQMVRNAVSGVMDDVMAATDASLGSDAMNEILKKKVA